MLSVFTRELSAFFKSITGFIFMSIFLLITGIFFTTDNLIPQSPSYVSVLGGITFIFLVVVPILTMRLLSEERHQKTDQLLLTSPLNISGIVLGKYFAAVTVFLLTLIITLIYPIQLSLVGTVSVSEITGGYIGIFLLGSAFIAVGLFVSSLTENQVVAAVVTFGLLLLMWILDFLQQGLPGDRFSGLVFAVVILLAVAIFLYLTIRNLSVAGAAVVVGSVIIAVLYIIQPTRFDGLIVRVLKWFSLLARYRDFTRGVLKLSSVVYYLSFSAVFIFLTVRSLDARRWK
jgi:ABC-2 type transport system permease protein